MAPRLLLPFLLLLASPISPSAASSPKLNLSSPSIRLFGGKNVDHAPVSAFGSSWAVDEVRSGLALLIRDYP
jgi:hypothetical protein